MAMQYHESPEELSNEAREWHRAKFIGATQSKAPY